jgi:hypothetical protein
MKLWFALLLVAVLAACKHPLEIVGEGDIVDLNGSGRGCNLEQFQAADPACTDNEVLGDYDVNLAAIPRPGWRFVRWDGACGPHSVAPNCAVTTAAAWVAWWDNILPDTPAPASVAVFERTDDLAELVRPVYEVNQLYFKYRQLLGARVYAVGFYGNELVGSDGFGYLVDNPTRLKVDEHFPHATMLALGGELPPPEWLGHEVMVYGVVRDYQAVSGNATAHPVPFLEIVEIFDLGAPAPGDITSRGNLYLDEPSVGMQSAAQKLPPPPALRASDSIEVFNSPPLTDPTTPGVQAKDCDRALIIAGGVDERSNYDRYAENVAAKYKRMRELGHAESQIGVFYNDGKNILGAGRYPGTNVPAEGASKQAIADYIARMQSEIPPSCTFTVFVNDHGTGYDPEYGYAGGRIAEGAEALPEGGKVYPEASFKFDLRAYTRRIRENKKITGVDLPLKFTMDELGTIRVYLRGKGDWEYQGEIDPDDNWMSEKDIDLDMDGDGELEEIGFSREVIEGWITREREFYIDGWDSDRDGMTTEGDSTDDVRVRYDFEGRQFVVQRWNGGEFVEIARDTNFDLMIDEEDGGVDWNMDGDRDDQVGFHEGINLWGDEVLWDDEMAELFKPLSQGGVHIQVEMLSCYGGGFLPNLQDIVENIWAGSDEDKSHWSRDSMDGKTIYAPDEIAFLDNLTGIDSDSFNRAAAAAEAEDNRVADMTGDPRNSFKQWQTPYFETNTRFQAEGDEVSVDLDIPDELAGQVYDFEFIRGLQNPRWPEADFAPDGVPSPLRTEDIPGGIRAYSSNPIPERTIVRLQVEGVEIPDGSRVRVEFTDEVHRRLGYTWAMPGTVSEQTFQDPPDDVYPDCDPEATPAAAPMGLDIESVTYLGQGKFLVMTYGMLKGFYDGTADMAPAFSAAVAIDIRLSDGTIVSVAREKHDSPDTEDLVSDQDTRMMSRWVGDRGVEIMIERRNSEGEFEPIDLTNAQFFATVFSTKTEDGDFSCDPVGPHYVPN